MLYSKIKIILDIKADNKKKDLLQIKYEDFLISIKEQLKKKGKCRLFQ